MESGCVQMEMEFMQNEMEQRLYTTLLDVCDLVKYSGGKTFVNELFSVNPVIAAELKESFDEYKIPDNYCALLKPKQ